MDPDHSLKFAVDDPIILAGVLIGAMMPLLFAALTMISVGKAAAEIIIEVPWEANFLNNPKANKCMGSSTTAAILVHSSSGNTFLWTNSRSRRFCPPRSKAHTVLHFGRSKLGCSESPRV